MFARVVALVVVIVVAGCGFRPLYIDKAEGDNTVREELAKIDVQGLGGRLGQTLNNDLEDALNPANIRGIKAYNLDVSLDKKTRSLAIQLDRTATRQNLTLKADFVLRRRSDGKVVYSSTVSRTAAYDVLRQPYATLIAEQDAEKRAAKELSIGITGLLALHFDRQGEDE